MYVYLHYKALLSISQELKHKRVCLIIVVHLQFSFCNSFPNSFHFHLLQFIFPFLHTLLSDIKEKKTPLIECKIQKRLEVIRVKFWFLLFESVKRILWCYHSNETSLAVLSYDTYLFFSILQNEIIQLDFDFCQLCQ